MGGNVYPVNYVPQAQMGMSLPGATGHMYARVGAPSNGKYAKKTLASAENGAWLDDYDIAQKGISTSKFKEFGKSNSPKSKLQRSTSKEENSEDYRRWTDSSEYKNEVKSNKLAEDKAIVKGRKDRINKSMVAQKKSFTKDNWRQQLADETQAIGDKLRIFPEDPDSFIDEWMNPGVMLGNMASDLGSAPLRAQQEDSYMPYVTGIGAPLLTGALEGIGAKTTGEFVSNLVNPLNIVPGYNSGKKYVGKKLAKATSNIDSQLVKNFPKSGSITPIIGDHLEGLVRGSVDIAKGRPIFETFPITKAQKQASDIAQNKAMEEGVDFVNNWFYKHGEVRPNIKGKIDNMLANEPSLPANDYKYDPFLDTTNRLVSSRSADLPFENISEYAKEYIAHNRGKISGVNLGYTDESITLRNAGMYKVPAEKIKQTVVHEAGHTSQSIGDNIRWGDITTNYSDDLKYFTANPNTNTGLRFKNALRTPGKAHGESYSPRTWKSSPNELHSELMSARSQMYDKFLKEGKSSDEAMELLQNPTDETLDALNKIGNLDRFFKQTRWGKSKVPTQMKRNLLRILPAAVPAVVGAEALQQKREGGVIKDDMGQWAHPGEITEINSNDITMEGVPYDVLGISDTGDTKLMKPGKNYKFKGKKVTEYPMAKNGVNQQDEKSLQQLNQLTNFTNYNTKQPGGWLDTL